MTPVGWQGRPRRHQWTNNGCPSSSCGHTLLCMAEQRQQRTRPEAKKATKSRDEPSRAASRPRGPEDAARDACRCLGELVGYPPEGASAVQVLEDGWRVDVDVLEVARIPDTTSLLATYEVDLDGKGHLVQYRRVRRYRRGASDDLT